MDEQLKTKLIEIFGKLAVDVGDELDPIYGAAVARMAWREFLALDQYLNADDFAKAKELIRSKMTAAELTIEKEKLRDLTWEMAESNAQGWNISRVLLKAGLKVVLAIALAAVGL